jgi:DNA topoisomerase IA
VVEREKERQAFKEEEYWTIEADFRSKKTIHNLKGKQEITVVNIQKFKEYNNGNYLKYGDNKEINEINYVYKKK